MKKNLITITGIVILAAAVPVILSCNGGPQNNNTANTNTAQINTAPSNQTEAEPEVDCKSLKKIDEDIKKAIDTDQSLKIEYQLKQFSYKAMSGDNGGTILVVSGRVSGSGKLGKFFKTFENLLKKGCVEKVIFVKDMPTSTPNGNETPEAAPSSGFEWTYGCESPLTDCSGICLQPPCPGVDGPTPTPISTPTP